ncbi:MAG: DUF1345 domain-containing protein [Xanthobacteraceae bacterium]|nr:DUF1345 domain-containing protein [Xanthobacteraceae bacterium]
MSAAANRPTWIVRVGMAHKRLVISAAIGIVTVLALRLTDLALVTRVLLGWDTGVAIYLVWAAIVMARCSTVAAIKRNAAIQDEGALAILLLTVGAAIASLGAIFAELVALERTNPHYGLHVALAAATVVLSWTFTHTIFALHYAHDFYGEASRSDGLKFPDNAKPDYWDFVYFSFVIGMTFQVSDVAVTNKAIRRMVVAHGALSFFFSTAIVALTVNIAAGLFQK